MKKFMIVALGCVLATGATAKTAGFQLSFTPDIAIQDRDTIINGVSIGVWNENPSSTFHWQFGFVNGATGDSTGGQWAVLLPTFYNYAENHTGLQWGFVNNTSGKFVGWQNGWIFNYANTFVGLQSAAVNISQMGSGVQFGFVNYTASAHNLFQVGVVNIIADNPWFSNFPQEFAQGFVLVNWSFGSY